MLHDLTSPCLDRIRGVVGAQYVLVAADERARYEQDQTMDWAYPCGAVVKPGTTAEVAALVALCNEYRVALTPRGGGTGVTGGALPVRGGVVLSLERLNRIVEIDTGNRYAVAEAGVITQHLQEAATARGLFLPVTPGSMGSSFVGGNVATGAGSPRSAKYGTLRNYVVNLEVVLPSGEVMWTGANVAKNASGLNLTALFTGSEGVLGVITQVVLRLLPQPTRELLLLVPFATKGDALRTVGEITGLGATPASLEIIGADALSIIPAAAKANLPVSLDGVGALLWIEFDGFSAEEVHRQAGDVAETVQRRAAGEVVVGESAAERQRMWKLRSAIGEAMVQHGYAYRDIDACVPRSALVPFVEGVDRIGDRYGLKTVSFGHAMDGNLHTMLLFRKGESPAASTAARQGVSEIYALAASLGGVVSGEHGIGLLQKEHLTASCNPISLQLMHRIKAVFDPGGIMNPGKIF